MNAVIVNLLFLVLAAAVAWWLSGYDTRITRENKTEDLIRRGVRCGITLLLVEIAFWNLWRWGRYSDQGSGMTYLIVVLPLPVLWAGCISEMIAHKFHRLLDPEDDREYDPDKTRRDLDTIARLIQDGRKEEAIQLCLKLKESGDASVLALDATLERLGVPQVHVRELKPLARAKLLRAQGQLKEAEALLVSLLEKDPGHVETAFLLMRLYAADLCRPDLAHKILQLIEQQPFASRAHIDYARRSIEEWSLEALRPKEKAEPAEANAPSVDELLAGGHFGSAIEMLEQQLKEQPRDFDLLLKLAEAQGFYCQNLQQAEKIVRRIEANSAFSAEQIQLARSKLHEWADAKNFPALKK